eukprot:3138979-Rhodomonas_salina.1
MSGTGTAKGALGLRACYAMSGTDLSASAYALCYAKYITALAYQPGDSSTHLAFGATRIDIPQVPVLQVPTLVAYGRPRRCPVLT